MCCALLFAFCHFLSLNWQRALQSSSDSSVWISPRYVSPRLILNTYNKDNWNVDLLETRKSTKITETENCTHWNFGSQWSRWVLVIENGIFKIKRRGRMPPFWSTKTLKKTSGFACYSFEGIRLNIIWSPNKNILVLTIFMLYSLKILVLLPRLQDKSV